MRRLIGRLREDERGASAIIIAMMMTVLLVVAALVIDVGASAARNAQLQDAADAAALALAQQCYESPATNEIQGCDPAVRTSAADTAKQFATATLNDGVANVIGNPTFDLHTVTVVLASPQQALFSWAAGDDGSTARATATAQWNQPAIALPLAVSSCSLPDPGNDTQFVAMGVYDDVRDLLGSITGILNGETLPGYVSNILDCGTDVLAGGWLASPNDDCTYDPNLITLLTSTLNKALPLNSCTQLLQSAIGKRVIVPVYESSTIQAIGTLGIGTAEVTRYAEIIVTGYDFDGVLGIGNVSYFSNGTSPGCTSSLQDFLGIDLGGLGALLDLLLAPLFTQLLPEILACQGLQGQIVNNNLTPEQASELLVPYRLIA